MDQMQGQGSFARATETTKYLRGVIPSECGQLSTAIICGSGLGGLSDAVHSSPRFEVSYKDIPHFPQSTVHGHAGKLLFGRLGDERQSVVLMVGRVHFYEGHSIRDVTFPIRVLKLLGVNTLILTNAAGGLNSQYAVGDLVMLSDHINFPGIAGVHPLRGPNDAEFGVRFPSLSDAYDLDLRRQAHRAWRLMNRPESQRKLHEGVYAFLAGPSYETRAECRMMRMLGADLVGMSTVPEIIVARHSGMRILALSLVTNNAVLEIGPSGNDQCVEKLSKMELLQFSEKGKVNHEEVLEAGRLAADDLQQLVCLVVGGLSKFS